MKRRLIYILLTGLLFCGSFGFFKKQIEPVPFSHTAGIQNQQGQRQLGTQIPDLPVPQFIISEDDRDEDEFSSSLRKPLVNRTGTDTPILYSCFNDPLTAFRKNYQRSVFSVSDIYIAHRTFRI